MYQQMPNEQPAYPSGQRKSSKLGTVVLLMVFILISVGGIGFGLWAFTERNDYKNNAEEKIAAAVASAVEETKEAKEKEFSERSKSPYDEYKGPAAFGSVSIKYPRTWSAFVTEDDKGSSTPVDGYFHPNVIPGIRSDNAFALRLQVLNNEYAKELIKYDSDSKSGKVKVSAVEFHGARGVRVDGEIDNDKKGSLILLPIRDKTLKLLTESESFTNDFNEIILPNMTFSP